MRRILVVDDEPDVRKFLKGYLEARGWDVVVAASAAEALALLEAQDFEVALVDLELGAGPSGLDVLRRRPARNQGCRFLLFSGKATTAAYREAFRCGAEDFLEKPIRASELLAILDRSAPAHPPQEAVSPAPATEMSFPAPPRGLRHVNVALRLIESRMSEQGLGTAGLARATNVTGEHLCRLFKRHLGCTPMARLHKKRVEKARWLVTETADTIYAIARACGYRTSRQLGRRFIREFGCTPTAARVRSARSGAGPSIPDHENQ